MLRRPSATDPAEFTLGLHPPTAGARDAAFLRLPLPPNGTEARHGRHTPAASGAGFHPLPQRHRSWRPNRLWRVRISLQNPRLKKTQARGVTEVDDFAWLEIDLGIAEGTFKARLHRGRELLRQKCSATGASLHVRTNWRMSSKRAPPFCSLDVYIQGRPLVRPGWLLSAIISGSSVPCRQDDDPAEPHRAHP